MKAEEDRMSDTLPEGHNTEERERDGNEIRESLTDSSPEMQSRFQAASIQRRSSLPVSIDSLPRSYRRLVVLELFTRLRKLPAFISVAPPCTSYRRDSLTLFNESISSTAELLAYTALCFAASET